MVIQEDYVDKKIEKLKDKIEEFRSELDQAIEDGLPQEEVYRRSIALDKLIEQYYENSSV